MADSEGLFRGTKNHLEQLGIEMKNECSYNRLLEAAVGGVIIGAGIASRGKVAEFIKGFPEATTLLEDSFENAPKGISEFHYSGTPEEHPSTASLSHAFSQGWHALEKEYLQSKNLAAIDKQ